MHFFEIAFTIFIYLDILAFAPSRFANRLKPLVALGLRRVTILVVLLRILALFGHVDDPLLGIYLQ